MPLLLFLSRVFSGYEMHFELLDLRETIVGDRYSSDTFEFVNQSPISFEFFTFERSKASDHSSVTGASSSFVMKHVFVTIFRGSHVLECCSRIMTAVTLRDSQPGQNRLEVTLVSLPQ